MSYEPTPVQQYQTAPPVQAYQPYESNEGKFPEAPAYKDPFWAVLYVIDLVSGFLFTFTRIDRRIGSFCNWNQTFCK
jgi:hypothetical protein